MKIGVVLFGHLRSFRRTCDSFNELKNVLKKAGTVDVFCHTWDIEESVTDAWWKQYESALPPAANVSTAEVTQTYQPAAILIEPSKKFDDSGYRVNSATPVSGVLSMLYSQFRSFELLKEHEEKHGFRYDIIIKTRYDILYEIASSFSAMLEKAKDSSCLYFPSSNTYELSGSWSDVFAAGSRDLMESCLSIYHNFPSAVSGYNQKGYSAFIPELCYSRYFDDNGIAIKETEGLRITILRTSGSHFQVNSAKEFKLNAPLCFYGNIIGQNEKLNPDTGLLVKFRRGLIHKYFLWLKPALSENDINLLEAFYYGKRLALRKIISIHRANAKTKIFLPAFLRSFAEESIHNRKNAPVRNFLLVLILTIFGRYGFFFCRVWIKKYLVGSGKETESSQNN